MILVKYWPRGRASTWRWYHPVGPCPKTGGWRRQSSHFQRQRQQQNTVPRRGPMHRTTTDRPTSAYRRSGTPVARHWRGRGRTPRYTYLRGESLQSPPRTGPDPNRARGRKGTSGSRTKKKEKKRSSRNEKTSGYYTKGKILAFPFHRNSLKLLQFASQVITQDLAPVPR